MRRQPAESSICAPSRLYIRHTVISLSNVIIGSALVRCCRSGLDNWVLVAILSIIAVGRKSICVAPALLFVNVCGNRPFGYSLSALPLNLPSILALTANSTAALMSAAVYLLPVHVIVDQMQTMTALGKAQWESYILPHFQE